MSIHPRAGQPAQPADLIDVAALVTAYYSVHPDPADVGQRVAFGTSGHRGSSLDGAFNDDHIAATTQAICDYRAAAGIGGPLFLARDTHALSEPAWTTALEVLAANGVRVLVDAADRYTPTPALSHAILVHNAGMAGDDPRRADGIVVTPSHNPPRDGGFKYNPPDGGPADGDITGPVQDRANAYLADRLAGVRRMTLAQALAADTTGRHDFMGEYVDDLPAVIDLDAIRGRRHPHRRRPAGRGERRLLGGDRRPARPRPHRGQPARRPRLALHDAGLGRQDPHGLLVPACDGVADRPARRVPDRDRQRRRLRPARHRHARRRAHEPEPLPCRRDRVPDVAPARLAPRRRGRQDRRELVDDRPRRQRRSAAGCGRCRSASSGSCRA